MKIIFRNYEKIVVIANITSKTIEQVEELFNTVFECYPDATFEYVGE